MIYSFVALADIHWGAMNATELYDHLQLVTEFIKLKSPDFVVICGDYFDYRLQLNSKTALTAIKWFDEFINICKNNNVKKVRLFKGTNEHDNNQLEVFRKYEKDDEFFKLFNVTTSEQLFPDLKVIYCPDENMEISEYNEAYSKEFIKNNNIGFFHGNFDVIMPKIEIDRIRKHHIKSMIYEYDRFSKLINGPLISGHWHNPQEYKSLYYIGSFDRWKFGEEEDKGFIYGEYNTDDFSYYIKRIVNPMAKKYITIIYENKNIKNIDDFNKIDRDIKDLLDKKCNVRVLYIVDEISDENLLNFEALQKLYKNKNVVFTLKDLNKKKKIKERLNQKNNEINSEEYNYILSKDVSEIPSIIQKYLKDKKDVDLDLEVIKKYVAKYIN